MSGYRNPPGIGDAVVKIDDVVNNFGTDSALSVVLAGDHFGAYSGMDVAKAQDVLYDINGDGEVSSGDLNLLLTSYNTDVHQDPTTGYVVDLNNDGTVNSGDLNLLLTDYGQGYTSGGGPAAPIPEPATMLLLVVGGTCALIRRKGNP
jgi:hypothetical protein